MVHKQSLKSPYVNAIDAAATGTSDGLQLALNSSATLQANFSSELSGSSSRYSGSGALRLAW